MKLALKIDVDTDRGTREGVPALVSLLKELHIPACFLFSLGPDNTGKAIRRVFRPGFFRKVSRTSVIRMYGLRTLLNGTLLPAPHIGRKNEPVMRSVKDAGFETGIHCHDHFKWQDYVCQMSYDQVRAEFGRAMDEYIRIFGEPARTAGAPGWQACPHSRQVYDDFGLLYSSDSRGTSPFFARIDDRVFSTLEIPSTLPTFDELLGRPEYPDDKIVPHYMSAMSADRLNVFTLHAEIEGMMKINLFRDLLLACIARGISFVRLDETAENLLQRREKIPVHNLAMREIDGRSGVVATECV